MRNKYSKEFENEMYNISKEKTFDELYNITINKYKYEISKKSLQKYLSKRSIRYKDYHYSKVRKMSNEKPLYSERIKDDGMIQVKIAPRKWEYKQRYIYSQYYGVELTDDDYIIFLDQDRTNFDIKNLKRVSRRESSIVANQKMFSKNPIATETGIQVAKLMIKLKEIKNETM